MIIDTHAHIFDKQYKDDTMEKIIKRANIASVEKMIIVGYNHLTNIKTLKMCDQHSSLYPAIGIHPSEVKRLEEADLINLEDLVEKNKGKIVAIGECGLDFYWDKDNEEKQIYFFKKQIDLAFKYHLPIIIHCRDAIQKTYEVLKSYNKIINGVMHCYAGSLEMAKEFIKLGIHLGIGGVVTFKNAVHIKDVVKHIDLKHLVVETDCPYLAPMPYRGKRNEPAYTKYIIEEICNIKNISYETVCEQTSKNAMELFQLSRYI